MHSNIHFSTLLHSVYSLGSRNRYMVAVSLLSSWLWDCQHVTSVEELMRDTLKPAFLSTLSSFFLDTDSLKLACSLTVVLMLLSFLNILRALVWLYGVSPKLLDYLYPALSLRFSFPFILLVRFRNTFLIRCQKKKKEKERKKGKEWLIEARDFSWSMLGWLYLQLSQLALHFHAFIWEPKEERSPSPEHSALLLFTLILQLWMLYLHVQTLLCLAELV